MKPRILQPAALKAKVLLGLEEPMLAEAVAYILEDAGFRILRASDGESVVSLARQECPQLIVLSDSLPTNLQSPICVALRRDFNQALPIPILLWGTGKSSQDKVEALNSGVDDYLPRPCGMNEFVARVYNLMRRSGIRPAIKEAMELTTERIRINASTREVIVRDEQGEQSVEMPRREFDLLYFLMSHEGEVLSREKLLERVWGYSNTQRFYGNKTTVDVHIKSLRKKIEPEPRKPRHIITVYGYGYRFTK